MGRIILNNEEYTGSSGSAPVTDVTVNGSSVVNAQGVAEVTAVQDNPTFTEASTRANIVSGESFAKILGKIKKFFADLKAVAFSGSYNDLSDKPTIPSAQVNSDWNANSGVAKILNKPTSLPASDVYAWAKASTKPSYTHDEIGGGALTIGDGAYYQLFRTTAAWKAGMYYQTYGDEAMVFGNSNTRTSWIFANTNPADVTNWTNLSPAMQIKNGKVAIGKLIADGSYLTYPLEVNGDVSATNFRGALIGNADTATKANLLKYQHNNEINFSGGRQPNCYFNYRDADTDSTANPISAINYYFSNYGNDASKATLIAGRFTGKSDTAGSADSATKATQDSDGNAINSTYLKKVGGDMIGMLGLYNENNVAVNFRNYGGYYTTISYQTAGNEACVFATKNAVTSWIFINGEDSVTNHATDRWQSLTPALQIKNNCVAIGKLIANGVTPAYKLEVAGDVSFNGIIRRGNEDIDGFYGSRLDYDGQRLGLTARNGAPLSQVIINTSSKRYKTNIEDLPEEEAKKILDVRTVTFDFKEKRWGRDRYTYDQKGVIAEEVEEIIPTAVRVTEIDGEVVPDAVDYSEFVPYLIKMVQMQQKEIDELKAIIKEKS